MGYYIIEPDGTVISSSQHQVFAGINTRMYPMTGIILTVNPSDDDRGNLTAGTSAIKRGVRHECTVWCSSDWGDPDTIITNVIIPPSSASGIDNYQEELPRGCINLVDGSVLNTDFADLDPAKLDGEWCVVDFIGGRIEYPFITNWWPHPANIFDPATSGSVVTINPKTEYNEQWKKVSGRSRFMRRRNGVLEMTNSIGDHYIDTTEADRLVVVSAKTGQVVQDPAPGAKQISGAAKPYLRQIRESAKGGNLQRDIKKSAQHEINFNEPNKKGPKIGAGSDSNNPKQDVDLTNDDSPSTIGTPPVRSTDRTLERKRQWSTLTSTSRWNVYAKNTSGSGGKSGTATVVADNQISLNINGSKTTMISMKDGEIILVHPDGTLFQVNDDEVGGITKSGAFFSLIGKSFTIMAEDGITTTSPVELGLSDATGITEFAMKSGSFVLSFAVWSAALATYLGLVQQDLTGLLGGSEKANVTALGTFTAATTAFLTGASVVGPAFSWISKQIKVK